MPIKGLTTQGGESFPEIGKLRKGAPKRKVQKKDKKTGQPEVDKYGNPVMIEIQGEDLDYFRFDSKDAKAIADFKAAYGDQPREINVLLPYDDVEQCFFTCKEHWKGGGLVHRCDGEFVSSLRVGQSIQRHFVKPVPCPGECKEVGRLKVIIPELNRFAYVTAETHGKWDVIFLHRQLSAVLMTFGQLRNLPFVLRRIPVEVSTPRGGDTRVRAEKWMLNIEIDPVWSQHRIAAQQAIALQEARMEQAIALPSPAQRIALPSGKPEPTNDYLGTEEWRSFKAYITIAEQDEKPFERLQKLQDWVYGELRRGTYPKHSQGAIERELEISRQRIEARNGQPLPKIPEREAIAVEAAQVGYFTDEDLDEF